MIKDKMTLEECLEELGLTLENTPKVEYLGLYDESGRFVPYGVKGKDYYVLGDR